MTTQAPIAYMFHPVTREYTGITEADPNPVREGDWIFPGSCTEIEPPKVKKNQVALFIDDKWTVKADYRGVHFWLADGIEYVINTIGATLPAGALLERPEPVVQEVQESLESSEEDVGIARAMAYANPGTGSDRLFAEAMRMQMMGEIGHEEVLKRAVARYNEIREQYPKPVE